jgi:hypothetical protein
MTPGLFLSNVQILSLAAQSDLKVATLGSPPKIRNKKLIEKR